MGVLNDICKAHGITLKCIHGGTKGAGYAIAGGDKQYIVVDGDASLWEQRFTVAHEIAHHLFGHLRAGADVGSPSAEMEANSFCVMPRLCRCSISMSMIATHFLGIGRASCGNTVFVKVFRCNINVSIIPNGHTVVNIHVLGKALIFERRTL